MLETSVILNVILLVGLIYMIFIHIGVIKDKDKDFIPDSVEDKFTQLKEDITEIKGRLSEELSDIGKAVKEVGNQIGDVPGVFKTKRKGRKPNK